MKLKNPKQEKFAQAVADGETATQAYRTHISNAGSINTAMQEACRLLKSPKVAARVSELRQHASDVLEHKLGVTKESVMRVLVEIIETPGDHVGKGHRLLERWEQVKKQKGKDTLTKGGMPSKLDAIAQLAKMCGWELATKAQLEIGGSLVEYAKGLLAALPQNPGLPTHGQHR